MLRIGTSGWNYPSGRGTWNGIFYPERSATAPRGFDELRLLRRAVQHRRSELHVLRAAARQRQPGMGRAHARRASSSPSSSIRSSRTRTLGARSQTPIEQPADVDAVQGGHRTARRRRTARAAAGTVSGQLQGLARGARLPATGCSRRFATTRSPSNCGTGAGATTPPTVFDLLHEYGAAWTQIDEPKFRFSIRQDLMPNVKTFYYLRLHGRNAAQWWEHEQVRGSLQLSLFGSGAEAVCRGGEDRARAGEEAVRLLEQSLRGAGRRRRRRAATPARRAGRRHRCPPSSCRAIRCSKARSLLCPLHGCSDDAIVDRELVARRPCPTMTLPKIGYLPSRWLAGPMTMKN